MFTAAVSQPNEHFNGLISIEPFVNIVFAQRNSFNRPAGSELMVPKSVNHIEFRDMQTKFNGIIDQIVAKHQVENKIEIQIDNATPHTGQGTQYYLNTILGKRDINGEYILQPPNSPDMNILDLAIFNSLQKNADKLNEDLNQFKSW